MNSSDSLYIDPMGVQNRQDLTRYLDQCLSGVAGDYYYLEDDDEVRQRATFVKSYLVEHHNGTSDLLNGSTQSVFHQSYERNDPTLLLLLDQTHDPYFADLSHPRITVIHSIARTDSTDKAIDRLTEGQILGFDRAWIPTAYLSNIFQGRLTGFKFGYSLKTRGFSDPVLSSPGLANGSEQPWPRFHMTVSNNSTAQSDFQAIMKSELFRGRKALERIQFIATDDDGDYIRTSLYSSGKIIANGTSINIHLANVEQAVQSYSRLLNRIEESALGWDLDENKYIHSGEPFLIRFPDDLYVEDLAALGSSIFRPARPFQMLGIPHNQSENRIDFEAIDLRTGALFSAELTRKWIRIFLPKGACGNVLLRMYFHLENSMTSDLNLVSGSGELVLSEGFVQ